jgi:hypothetical protein
MHAVVQTQHKKKKRRRDLVDKSKFIKLYFNLNNQA